MRPRPIPPEALDYYTKQIEAGQTAVDTCRILRDEFPDTFSGTSLDNVSARMRREFREKDLPLPDATGNYNMRRALKANRSFPDQRPELVIPYRPRVAIASDFHFPAHCVRTTQWFVDTVRDMEIQTVVLNGDQLNNEYKGHKGQRENWASQFEEGVDALRGFVGACQEAGASELVVIMGNHDDKALRDTDLEQSWHNWWRDILADSLDQYDRVWIAERYRAIMEPQSPGRWPFTQGCFPTRFSHQKNYGQSPGTVARKLATKYLSHMVCGHQHHGSISKHASNLLMAVDVPCGADPDLAGYKDIRDTGHPEWTPGFATLIEGVPTLYDRSNL